MITIEDSLYNKFIIEGPLVQYYNKSNLIDLLGCMLLVYVEHTKYGVHTKGKTITMFDRTSIILFSDLYKKLKS